MGAGRQAAPPHPFQTAPTPTRTRNSSNYFKERDNGVFQKLQKASILAASDDPEDAALLLTEVRRALKAAADHFYPPRAEAVVCSDGKERVLGDDRYLNRLNEYLASQISASTAR